MAFTAPTTRATDFLVTAAVWNTEHVDNMNTAWPHLVVRKPSDESVTSSTTLQNDDHLLLPVLANEVWRFTFDLIFSALGGADFKFAFTFPASGEIIAGGAGQDSGGGTITNKIFEGTTTPTTSQFVLGPGAAVKRFLRIEGVFITAGTAGNLQLQWAQNTSNATATIVRTNSTLWAVRLA